MRREIVERYRERWKKDGTLEDHDDVEERVTSELVQLYGGDLEVMREDARILREANQSRYTAEGFEIKPDDLEWAVNIFIYG